MTFLLPYAVLDGGGLRRDVAVELDGAAVGRVLPAADVPSGAEVNRLTDRLLTPGLVNAHSHAFQRDLRGRVEHVDPARPGDDFWTWREAMYAGAARMDPERIRDVTRRCFVEMRHAGYTSVGEFHYVHHQPDGTPYARPNALAEAVCAAAEEVGLRIVLLLVAYARGGAGREPEPGQRRFCDPTVEAYLERLDALAEWSGARPLVTVGAAPHSVRAVPAEWLRAIGAHCDRRYPLHVHADEQPREIAECLAEHGCRPVELLARTGALGPHATIVHGTHCDDAEIALLAGHDATVCVCPTTEGNLGDGYVPARRLHEAGVRMCVGSDSNVRIDGLEELRELELVARRSALRRNVLVRADEDGPAPTLLRAGWADGARALGLPEPRIATGAPADLVAWRLDGDELHGVADDDLAAALVFAGSARSVDRTWIDGREEVA